jgi:hypothetical protein
VRKRVTLATVLWLASTITPAAAPNDGPPEAPAAQDPGATKAADQKDAPADDASARGSGRKKAPGRAALAKKKAERSRTPKKKADRDAGFTMDPGVVCKSIDGFENYEPLPGAAQTSDEKLLVYFRPHGFQTEKVEGKVVGHLTADGELRKRGEKNLLRQKKKMLDYKPSAVGQPEFVYLKSSVSLKGLSPGDYELTIILHDELAKGATATQAIKFKVIPAKDPRAEKPSPMPHELDRLYEPFVNFPIGEADD